jgi:hypothetical protein
VGAFSVDFQFPVTSMGGRAQMFTGVRSNIRSVSLLSRTHRP